MGETCVIRVPIALSDTIKQYAKCLDSGGMVAEHQFALELQQSHREHSKYNSKKPVNVASVPQRSPFRYPGGKTWLVPLLRKWLENLPDTPSVFIEPFAGGAIASLTAAFERLADHCVLAELEEGVAAVWRTVLTGQADWLANQIVSFDLDEKKVRKALARDINGHKVSLREKAFLTILRNRVQRSGIMAPGAGLIKSGENGRGLRSRWYPETISKRIIEISEHRRHLSFYPGDGFRLIEEYTPEPEAVFFIDPPYTRAARRLYQNWNVDHRKLFELMSQIKGDFLMTYDESDEIRELVAEFGFEVEEIAMKNGHHRKMNELVISRSLKWMTSA